MTRMARWHVTVYCCMFLGAVGAQSAGVYPPDFLAGLCLCLVFYVAGATHMGYLVWKDAKRQDAWVRRLADAITENDEREAA